MKTYVPRNASHEGGVEKAKARGSEIAFWLQKMTRELRERGDVAFDDAERLRTFIELSKKEFAAQIGVDPRTLTRFRARGRLNPAASDRVYRLARLLEVATELHDGDEVRATRWLKTPNRALGDRRPIDMVATQPDFERVMDLVGALEEGVFV